MASPFIWDGGGSDNHWATAANWVGDVAPLAGSSLLFIGAGQTTTYNNFTAGTAFKSIKFAASGFSVAGHSLTLTDSVTVDSGVTGSAISANIVCFRQVCMNRSERYGIVGCQLTSLWRTADGYHDDEATFRRGWRAFGGDSSGGVGRGKDMPAFPIPCGTRRHSWPVGMGFPEPPTRWESTIRHSRSTSAARRLPPAGRKQKAKPGLSN